MATQTLASFNKRYDREIAAIKLELLEYFDNRFKWHSEIWQEAIDWCSKKRLEIVKELI